MTTILTPIRSREERDQLVEQFLPLVHHIVGRLTIRLPAGIEKDDLFSAGVLGLMNAAESFDAGRGASFKTYGYTIIRGAILDELRRLDPITRSGRERIRKLEAKARELASEKGRTPTREELATALGCSLTELDQDQALLQTARTLSIDDGGEDSPGFAETLVGPQARPEEILEKKEALEALSREIANLPQQDCQVVILYYHEGLLLKDIGTILGVSESRVCQILSKAQTLLKMALDD